MIPNRFHFVYGLQKQTQPFHLVHYLCLKSCLEVNQPDTICLYYRHSPFGKYWDLIKDRITLVQISGSTILDGYVYQRRIMKPYAYAHVSDFVRMEKLLDAGGIYADLDSIFVNPIPADLFNPSFVLGREPDVCDEKTGAIRPSLCNAFIMAEQDAPFGRLWQKQMFEYFDGTWSRHSTLLPYQLSQQYPDLIHIEPQHSFYKYDWTREGLHRLLEECERDNTDVISMHLWAHLWWSRWRRDFSSFHAGRLTQDFIRRVDTTYTLIARKYLPPDEKSHRWWLLEK